MTGGFIPEDFRFNGVAVVSDKFGKINDMGMNVLEAEEGVHLESRGREGCEEVKDCRTVLVLVKGTEGNALIVNTRVTVVVNAAGCTAGLVVGAGWGHGDLEVESEVQVLVASSCFGRRNPGALVEPFGLLISLEQVW